MNNTKKYFLQCLHSLLILWMSGTVVWAQITPSSNSKLDLTLEEQNWLTAHPVIRFGTDSNWLPYAKLREDGSAIGIEVDLLAYVNALTGANIRLELGRWSDMVARAERGELEGLAASAAHPERAAHFLFSNSLYSAASYIYARTDSTSLLRSMEDLGGKKVGMLRGNLLEQKILARWSQIIPVLLDSYSDLAVALLNGEVDAVISGVSFLVNIRDSLLPNFSIAFTVPNTETPLVYSIRKEYPELLSIVNKALAAMSQQEMNVILEKWGTVHNAPTPGLSLTPKERAWLAEHPKIVLGITDQFQPAVVTQGNGKLSGLVVDYLNLLNQHLGSNYLQLQVEHDWLKVTDKALKRELAGLASAVPNSSWDQSFLYTQPYYHGYLHLYVNKDSQKINSLVDLAGKRVGYMAGLKKIEDFIQEQKIANLQLVPLNDNLAMATVLLEQQVDAVVGTLDFEWWRRQNSLVGIKTIGILPDSRFPVVMAIRNDWSLLTTILNKALSNIPAYEHERIRKNWLGTGDNASQLLSRLPLTEDERNWIQSHPVVRARASRFPPYHFWDSGAKGISVELLNNIAEKAGFRVEYVYPNLNWADALERIRKSKDLDILLTAKYTPEREIYLNFTENYLHLPWVIFTRKDEYGVYGLGALAGKTIAMEKGYVLQEQLAKDYPQIKQLTVPDAAQALFAVSKGQADAYVGNLTVAQYHIVQQGFSNLKVAADADLGAHTQAFAVRKDWPQLVSIINKGLAAISPEERNTIQRKYFSVELTETIDYRSRLEIIGGALLIIMIILYWNRKLAQSRQALQQAQTIAQTHAERLHSVLDSIDDLIFVLDAQGYFIDSYQDDLEKMMMSPIDFIGRHYREILPVSLSDQLDQAILHAQRNGPQSFEYPLKTRSGWHWFSASLSARYDAKGQFSGSTVVARNISERKQMEEALRDSQLKYQRLVDDIGPNCVIFSNRADGSVEYLSNSFTHVFGLSSEEAMGRTWQDMVSWDKGTLEAAWDIQSQFQSGLMDVAELEMRFTHRDGTLRTLSVTAHAVYDEQGKHIYNQGIALDITTRKRAEEALRQSEERYRSLITAMAEGIVMQNYHGEIMECNAAAQRILGVTKEQMMGRTSVDPLWKVIREDGSIFPGEEHPLVLALQTGRSQCNIIQGVYRPTGELIWILVNAEPLFQLGEKLPYAGMATFTDITASRNAKLEVEEKRRTLQTVLENIPVGVQVFAPDLSVLMVNQRAAELLGRPVLNNTQKEDLQQTYEVFIYGTNIPYPLEKMPVIRAFSGEISMVEDMEVRRLDGSKALLQVIGAPIHNEQNKIISSIVIFQDILARKHVEEELIRARQAAEAANQAKSAFLANMSHELRTPLNAILGFAQILLSNPGLAQSQLNQIQRILNGGEYLLTLINDILDLAKVEAGRFELLPDTWNTQSFFRELEYIFQTRAEQKGIYFRHEIVEALPQALYCDNKRLRQIIINLLGNAIKFTAEGGVVLRSHFVGNHLHLKVIDTGTGIAPEHIEKIFEPFQQTGEDRYKIQGTGLGLAITQRLVAAMGGKLNVESVLGQGSVFHVIIPSEVVCSLKAAQSTCGEYKITGYQRSQGTGPFKILVIDDIADNREVLRYLLEPLGFNVIEAKEGQEGITLAQIEFPDLILMDLRMHGIDGLETTRRLRTLPAFKTVPIVALSASIFADDYQQTQLAGCNAHLGKPVHLRELLDTLGQLLPLNWNVVNPVEKDERIEMVPEPLSSEQNDYFQELVSCGDVLGLQELAKHWAKLGCCPILSTQLTVLLEGFDLDGLRKLAEFYISD